MKSNTLELARKSASKNINELELAMVSNFNEAECPVVHRFTEGMYVRETTVPTGSLVTSRIHKTQHTYFIMKGKVIVWIDGVEQLIEAPFIGITEPNTRRVVYVLEEVTWVTSHPNPDNENLEQIAERILEKNDNPLLSVEIKNRLDNLIK
jgi:quercetin dioxygenase-like cupin family protein